MRRIVGIFLITVLCFCFTGCKTFMTESTKNESKCAETESEDNQEQVISEFEENGVKYYKQSSKEHEIIYLKWEGKILNRELIDSFDPLRLGDLWGITSGALNVSEYKILNIYKNEPVSNVKLTLYNCSGWLGSGTYKIDSDFYSVRKCEEVKANIESDAMISIYVVNKFEDGIGIVEQNKIISADVDAAVIKADITYEDMTTKTEYLSLGSYEGKHCNYLDIYRLTIEE